MTKSPRSALGSITLQQNGIWQVRISAGVDPITGKRIRVAKNVRGTKRDAEAVLAKLLIQYGELVTTSLTLESYLLDIYLPWCAERLRANTVLNYRNDCERHIIPELGHVPLIDLDAFAVEKFLMRIPKPGARKKTYKTLRQALRQARRWKMVKEVVTDAIPEPKVPHYEPRVLTAEEAAKVIEAFHDDPVEIAILLALGCGLRRSEILGLDWSDIDHGEVHVTKSYTCVNGTGYLNEPKTFNSRRYVSIPESFKVRIEQLRPSEDDRPILVGEHGGRMNPDVLTDLYEKTAHEKKVRFTSLKNLRHSHATIMLSAGVDIVTVSRRLGHSSVSITDKFYLRPTRAADEKAASAFDSLNLVGSSGLTADD